MYKENWRDQQLTGNEKYEGYCIDLLDAIASSEHFDNNMKYVIREVADNSYGRKDADGRWNGMIGELLSGVSGRLYVRLSVRLSLCVCVYVCVCVCLWMMCVCLWMMCVCCVCVFMCGLELKLVVGYVLALHLQEGSGAGDGVKDDYDNNENNNEVDCTILRVCACSILIIIIILIVVEGFFLPASCTIFASLYYS